MSGGASTASALTVTFPDLGLEMAVRSQLPTPKPTGAITDADMSTLTTLALMPGSIHDLDGLQYATGLRCARLNQNLIADLAPLSGLTSLTELQIGNNPISTLAPIVGLKNLTVLVARGDKLTDISELSQLKNLTQLSLDSNNIATITPLAGLTSLQVLHLEENKITDIGPVRTLTNLTWLALDYNQITSISALSTLTRLNTLSLRFNHVGDIGPVNALIGLTKSLNVTYNDLDLRASKPAMLTINKVRGLGAVVYYQQQNPNCPPCRLRYIASIGGKINGIADQTVVLWQDGTTVTAAVKKSGYHFAKWSDGVTTASRIDTGVVDDITVTALFVQSTKVTITSNHTSVVHKHPVAFSGTVSSNLAKNTHVAVYVLRPGTTTWVLLSTRHTTSTHRWTYTYSPSTKGTWYFQARYAGSSKYAASTSSSRKITVK
jgi:hypothetical protein